MLYPEKDRPVANNAQSELNLKKANTKGSGGNEERKTICFERHVIILKDKGYSNVPD